MLFVATHCSGKKRTGLRALLPGVVLLGWCLSGYGAIVDRCEEVLLGEGDYVLSESSDDWYAMANVCDQREFSEVGAYYRSAREAFDTLYRECRFSDDLDHIEKAIRDYDSAVGEMVRQSSASMMSFELDFCY